MAVTVRDKTTAANQMAVASDGSITVAVKGNGTPPSRNMYYWSTDGFLTASASEALITFNESLNGASSSSVTSHTITSGKTLRLTSFSLTVETNGSSLALSRVYVGIRFATAGSISASSQLVWRVALNTTTTAKTINTFFADFPDGIEFLGDGTKQIALSYLCSEWVVTNNAPKISLGVVTYEY